MIEKDIHNYLKEIYKLCDDLDLRGYGVSRYINTDKTTREIFELELLYFLLSISASDDVFSETEVEILNTLFNPSGSEAYVSSEQWETFLKECDLDDFEHTVPISLKCFVEAENALYAADEPADVGCASKVLIEAYQAIGVLLMSCDVIDQTEVSYFTKFISTLNQYVKENSHYVLSHKYKVDTDVKKIIRKYRADLQREGSDAQNVEQVAGEKKESDDSPETLDELLGSLDSLIGLENVKNDVNSLINLVKIRKVKEERGLKQAPMSLHMVFYGNPGTGKTTVARLISKIYNRLGILSKGHLTEVDRSGLVGGYVGQTAIKTNEVIQNARGGILFIDEAYSLTAGKGENDYGQEAIETLLKGMEDYREDLIVIVAGYPDLMNMFLNSNPGLRSRFNKYLFFEDYNTDELILIFKLLCDEFGVECDKECYDHLHDYFEKRVAMKDNNFANGREVRNVFEKVMVNQANRLAELETISDEDIKKIQLSDCLNITV